ncbi:MAG: MFS transporter [Chloroflexota bacterium]
MKLNRAFVLIAIAFFAFYFNMGINGSVSINFFKEELHLGGMEMGYYTASRELAGFLLVIFAAATARFPATRMAAFALFVAGLGYGAYAITDSFAMLLPVAVIGSIGFHSFTQLYYLLALGLAEPGFEGRVLGRLQTAGALGTFVAMILAFLVVASLGYRNIFLISGAALFVGAIALLFVPANPRMVRQQGFVFKRRYWLYYVLNFLDGCRFEIFATFGVFALVDVYGVNVQTIALLMLVTAALTWVVGPLIGAWIDRLGERVVLGWTYVGHVLVFAGFALVPNVYFLFAMYLGYRLLDVARMGLNTYAKKISQPQDLSPNLAMGVTMSHAAAIIVPITGGILWQTLGYQVSFLFGAVFVAFSVAFTQLIRDHAPVPAAEAAV